VTRFGAVWLGKVDIKMKKPYPRRKNYPKGITGHFYRGKNHRYKKIRPVESLSLTTLIRQSKRAYKAYLHRQGDVLEDLTRTEDN